MGHGRMHQTMMARHGGMGPAMMGRAMSGGHGFEGHGRFSQGAMGQGAMGQGAMGQGAMGLRFGGRVTPMMELSTRDVQRFFTARLERLGNKRLKLGEIKEEGDDMIVDDIVTVDDSLVERLKIDRRTGWIQRGE